MNKFIVIATYGPSFSEQLANLAEADYPELEFFFRLNGAHVLPDNVEECVTQIRDHFESPRILMDLPGSKLRTKHIEESIGFQKDVPFELPFALTNYPDALKSIKVGDVISTHDSKYRMKVQKISKDSITIVPNLSGYLQNGKGLHIQGAALGLPFISDVDHALIAEAIRLKLWGLDLSYVRSTGNLDEVQKIIGENPVQLLPKIETFEAMENLQAILSRTPFALVDRGDLAGEIGIENIPTAQSTIIQMAHWCQARIIFATQFFTSMVESPVPLIAELNDCHNCIQQGIAGIQLSEETAIGKHVSNILDHLAVLVRNAYLRNKSDVRG